jgi:hypothetical protein
MLVLSTKLKNLPSALAWTLPLMIKPGKAEIQDGVQHGDLKQSIVWEA